MRMLKQEEVYLANDETYLDVVENLPIVIEEIYNEKRVHSSINYLAPNELEAMVAKAPTTAGPLTLTLYDSRSPTLCPQFNALAS